MTSFDELLIEMEQQDPRVSRAAQQRGPTLPGLLAGMQSEGPLQGPPRGEEPNTPPGVPYINPDTGSRNDPSPGPGSFLTIGPQGERTYTARPREPELLPITMSSLLKLIAATNGMGRVGQAAILSQFVPQRFLKRAGGAGGADDVDLDEQLKKLNILRATRDLSSNPAAEAASVTAAKETAQRMYGNLGSETQRRLGAYDSLEANLKNVSATYKPEFVGKGFQVFGQIIQDHIKEVEASEIRKDGSWSGKYATSAPGAFVGQLKQFIGTAPPEQVRFYRSLLDMADQLLRARSGAQINEEEYGRLIAFIPTQYDEPNTFEPKFNDFSDQIRGERESILNNAMRSPQDMLKAIQGSPRLRLGGIRNPTDGKTYFKRQGQWFVEGE